MIIQLYDCMEIERWETIKSQKMVDFKKIIVPGKKAS